MTIKLSGSLSTCAKYVDCHFARQCRVIIPGIGMWAEKIRKKII